MHEQPFQATSAPGDRLTASSIPCSSARLQESKDGHPVPDTPDAPDTPDGPDGAGITDAAEGKPAVTVLMTVYNGMPYLRDAVSSILGQTCREFIFFILNNGSTDETADYLNSLQDSRIRLFHLPDNIGRTPVLNKGLGLVQSPLTAVIDADDISLPTRLERQKAFLDAHPDVDILGSDVQYIDRNGTVIGEERFPHTHERLRDRLPLFNQFAHAACMFRTDAARAAGGYPEDFAYAQDIALWMAMMRRGSRSASIGEYLSRIRVHPGQTTKNLSLLRLRTGDDCRLAEIMRELPGMGIWSVQAAFIRQAACCRRLGRYAEAAKLAGQGIQTRPLLLFFNPILWARLCRSLKKASDRGRQYALRKLSVLKTGILSRP